MYTWQQPAVKRLNDPADAIRRNSRCISPSLHSRTARPAEVAHALGVAMPDPGISTGVVAIGAGAFFAYSYLLARDTGMLTLAGPSAAIRSV